MATWYRRIVHWFRRARAEAELVEELQFHRESAERDLQRLGLSEQDAARSVTRRMGNVMRAREEAHEVWVAAWVDALWQDLRHAAASLRRSPGLVLVSALSLGLGIGVNSMLYMGIDTIYRHRPTMTGPERMVAVEPGNANQFSHPDYQDLVRSGIFEDAAGFRNDGFTFGSGARSVRMSAVVVTANFFTLLGITAQTGRTFSAADAAPERDPRVVVVTDRFWRARMGADPAAIGQPVLLNGDAFTIVGVLPEGYRAVNGWLSPDLYVPVSRLTLTAFDERASPSLTVLARLPVNAHAAGAQAAVTALSASLERAYPERLPAMGRSASVYPASAAQFRGSQRQFQLVVTIAWITAVLVLLIACVNVAGLLVARTAHRRREIAIRVALGAGRARVVQTVLVESLLLVVTGAAVGVPLAFAFNRIPVPGTIAAMQFAMTPDSRLLPYVALLVVVMMLVCGGLPAWRAARGDVVSEVGRGGEGATPRMWTRQALVVGQVAMSLVLIVAALLCVRSQLQIGRVDLGFDVEHGLVARFALDRTQYPGQARVRFGEQIVERIGAIPGLSLASIANVVPLGGDSLARSFHPAGRTDIPGTRPSAYSAGPGYFRALAIPIVRGRDFDATHRWGTPAVAIVNETYANTYFPGRDAIGQRVATAGEADAEVIGVVRDHHIGTIGEASQSVVFYPYAQRPRDLVVHARASISPESLVAAVERVIDDIDAAVPVSVQTLRAATSLEMTMRVFAVVLMGTMGVLGLLLATIGLYGVMTYLAAARTAEVGIRMALGATRHHIRTEMLGRGLVVVGYGVLIGAVASFGLMPALGTFLAGVSPFDPVAFGGAAALLAFVGLAASYLPARRSSQLDPMRALREL